MGARSFAGKVLPFGDQSREEAYWPQLHLKKHMPPKEKKKLPLPMVLASFPTTVRGYFTLPVAHTQHFGSSRPSSLNPRSSPPASLWAPPSEQIRSPATSHPSPAAVSSLVPPTSALVPPQSVPTRPLELILFKNGSQIMSLFCSKSCSDFPAQPREEARLSQRPA